MKRFLIFALFCITTFSITHAFDYPRETRNLPRRIFLRSQMAFTSVRSTHYSVIGSKDSDAPVINLLFMCNGSFLITISDENNSEVYSYQLLLPLDNKEYNLIIPIHSFEDGTYTVNILNTNNGKTASGDFIKE